MEAVFEVDPLQEFFSAIKNPLTKRYYTKRLSLFFSHMEGKEKEEGKDLAEQARIFIARAKSDHPDYAWTTGVLNEYMRYHRDRAERKEISESTLINYYKPVKLFLEENNVVLNWKKISRRIPRGRRYANDRAPDREEIRQVLSYPDPRIKSVGLIMTSSGCRLGAFDYLNVGDIEPIGNKGAAKIIIYRGTNDEYFSFITPEAYAAVEEYLEHRKDQGERITKDSPLVRDLVRDLDRWGRGVPNKPERLKATGVMRIINDALLVMGVRKKLEKGKGKKRHEFQADHGFRKFFNTVCDRHMKTLYVEFLMGHNTGLKESYNRAQEDELLEEYLKAVPELTIFSSPTRIEDDDVEKRLEAIEARAKQMEEKAEMREKRLVANMTETISTWLESPVLHTGKLSKKEIEKMRKELTDRLARLQS
jgi:integrase